MLKLRNRGRLATQQTYFSRHAYATRYSLLARVMQSARRKGRCGAAWRENGGDLTGFGRSNESEGRSERAADAGGERGKEGGMNSTFSSVFATEQTDGHSDKERKGKNDKHEK